MTRNEILNYLDSIKDTDNINKNIAMFLIDKRLFAKKLSDIDTFDIDTLLDNIIINCQIIESHNVDEYPRDLFTNKQYQQIKNNEKIMLLDYYDINGGSYHECKILLDNVNYYNFK